MERALRGKEHAVSFSSNLCVVEKVQEWLEKEDTDAEKIVGYGLCLASCTYLFARLFQWLA